MNTADLSYYTPSIPQLILAVACVWAVQKLKVTDRWPWVNEYTDKTNQFISVGLALVVTAVFNVKEYVAPDPSAFLHYKLAFDSADKALLLKNATLQYSCQYAIYQVGVKDSIKALFRAMGAAPPLKTAISETHSTETVDGVTVRKDMVAKVTVKEAVADAPPDSVTIVKEVK